jgi:hypothetical protein
VLWHSESVVQDPHVPPPLLLLVLPPASLPPPPLLLPLLLPLPPLLDELPPELDVPELEPKPDPELDPLCASSLLEPPASSPKLKPPLLESPDEQAATKRPPRRELAASVRRFIVRCPEAPIVPRRAVLRSVERRVISRQKAVYGLDPGWT